MGIFFRARPRGASPFASAVVCAALFAMLAGFPMVAGFVISFSVSVFGSSLTELISIPYEYLVIAAGVMVFCIMYIAAVANARRTLIPLGLSWLVSGAFQTAVLIIEIVKENMLISGIVSIFTGSWKYRVAFIFQIITCLLIGVMVILFSKGVIKRRRAVIVFTWVGVVVHVVHLLMLTEKLAPAELFVPILIPLAGAGVVIGVLVLFAPMILLIPLHKKEDNGVQE